jgi:DUF1016 N-terminal domain
MAHKPTVVRRQRLDGCDLHGSRQITAFRRRWPSIESYAALLGHRCKILKQQSREGRDRPFVQQVVARLPWGHIARPLENVKDHTRREWYAPQAIEHGWNRNVLIH